MKIKNLIKLPISHLILIIVDDKQNSFLRKFAEIELKNRIKNLGINFDDLIQMELKKIRERGIDINNYLFSSNPNIQQLMELYFSEVYETKFEDSKILLSESHLCTDMNFMAKFFDKICDIEIKNLSERIDFANPNKETLLLFKNALEERKKEINKERKFLRGTDILEFNFAFNSLEDISFLFIESDLSTEEIYNIQKSKIKFLKLFILISLSDKLFESDLLGDLYILKRVLQDSSKLNNQRNILLSQMKSGFIVDYETENMQKAKQRILNKKS